MNRAPNAEDARRATRLTVAFMLLILMATTTLADNPKPHQVAPVPIQQVVIQDEFWSPKLKTWRKVTIPDCLAKFEKDGALSNFDKIRDGTGGEHGGPPWYDGLIYEMIRGGADFLASQRDAVLEARLDSYIERIAAAAAKDPDGYLNTYFYENPLEAGPKRVRWAWHGCPCCPPMFLKIMGALPGYLYAQ